MQLSDKDGVTVRDHYEQMGRYEDAASLEFPEVLSYLWAIFTELHTARPMGGMSAGPLTFEGIAAWSALNDYSLQPWEVRALKDLDKAWLGVQAEQMKRG